MTRPFVTARPAARTLRIAGLLGPVLAVLLVAGCAEAPRQAADTPPPAGAAAAPSPAAPAAPAVRTVRVSYAGGTVTGDTGTVAITRGEAVQIVVTSDVADEAHLHGYDREAPLTAGRPATIAFTANIPGEFELELHGSGAQLATLQVS
ncbi:hypothetical protein EV383_3712 [Pseudonocardia sediminis]|uniref:Cupredoxin-like protein n=1 Tax=Pseudonocardia sediminis TaxID=1397368 RepID=A0A4Q7V2F8_PSEST|nr:hypothetical protein [Pseudonocardia sediminis]RZT86813.1 hypothetical protein EV383_3712 [Pseudonocardia sediminis]